MPNTTTIDTSRALSLACDRLAARVHRHDSRTNIVVSVAEMATTCVELSQTFARGLANDVATTDVPSRRLGRSLLRAVRAVRRFSVEHAVSSHREWCSCDPISLIETGPWDGLHLLLFLTECHLRACVAKLFSDAKGKWEGVVGASSSDIPPLSPKTSNKRTTRDDVVDDVDDVDDVDVDDVDVGEVDVDDVDVDDVDVDEVATREALEKGLVPCRVRALLSDVRPCRSTMALVVCLDDVVPSRERDEDEGMFNGTRPSRLGVRLLERHALAMDAIETLEREIERRSALVVDDPVVDESAVDESAVVNDPVVNESAVDNVTDDDESSKIAEWTRRTIEVDSNNALLLRMDEWAIVDALCPHEVAFATGERGSVPQEHRNAPAAWVAQRARPDVAYRELMKSSKQNATHAANAYVCFSGTLEQHHAFDWLTRCFVSRLSPVGALRKVREYFSAARARTAPLVVELTSTRAIVLYRSTTSDAFVRRECATPYETIRAWMETVRDNTGGAYSRKANVMDVMERIKRPTSLEKIEAPSEIGGASLRVN